MIKKQLKKALIKRLKTNKKGNRNQQKGVDLPRIKTKAERITRERYQNKARDWLMVMTYSWPM